MDSTGEIPRATGTLSLRPAGSLAGQSVQQHACVVPHAFVILFSLRCHRELGRHSTDQAVESSTDYPSPGPLRVATSGPYLTSPHDHQSTLYSRSGPCPLASSHCRRFYCAATVGGD